MVKKLNLKNQENLFGSQLKDKNFSYMLFSQNDSPEQYFFKKKFPDKSNDKTFKEI